MIDLTLEQVKLIEKAINHADSLEHMRMHGVSKPLIDAVFQAAKTWIRWKEKPIGRMAEVIDAFCDGFGYSYESIMETSHMEGLAKDLSNIWEIEKENRAFAKKIAELCSIGIEQTGRIGLLTIALLGAKLPTTGFGCMYTDEQVKTWNDRIDTLLKEI